MHNKASTNSAVGSITVTTEQSELSRSQCYDQSASHQLATKVIQTKGLQPLHQVGYLVQVLGLKARSPVWSIQLSKPSELSLTALLLCVSPYQGLQLAYYLLKGATKPHFSEVKPDAATQCQKGRPKPAAAALRPLS